jgi:hypothetical protein
MDVVLPFLAAAALLSAGFGCSALLLRDRATVSWAELVATTLLLGTFTVTFGWWWTALLLPDRPARLAVGLAAALTGSIGAVAWSRRAPRLHGAPLALLVLVPSTLFIGWVASRARFGWDGLLVWQLKAEAIVSERGVPWRYFHDDSRAWSLPIYPLLVPMQRAWLFTWHGVVHQGAAKLLGAVYFAAVVGLMLGPGRRLGRAPSWLALAFLACTPLAIVGNGSATSGYADFPLAAYYLGAVLYLLPIAADGVPHDWPIAACLAAGLPWIKQEGKILWLCWGALAVVSLGRRRWRQAGLALLPGAVTFAAWSVFVRAAGVESAKTFDHPTIALLWERLYLAPEIGRSAVKLALDPQLWGWLWPLFLLATLTWPWWSGRRAVPPLLLAAAALLPLPIYCLPYFFTRWRPVSLHVEGAFDRMLLHVALPALLFVATATAAALSVLRPRPRPEASPDRSNSR